MVALGAVAVALVFSLRRQAERLQMALDPAPHEALIRPMAALYRRFPDHLH
jgi:hypothetical protein